MRRLPFFEAIGSIALATPFNQWPQRERFQMKFHASRLDFRQVEYVVDQGLAYLCYGIVSRRFRRKLFPISWHELIATMRDALTIRLKHDDLTHYNAVQKLLYIGIMLV